MLDDLGTQHIKEYSMSVYLIRRWYRRSVDLSGSVLSRTKWKKSEQQSTNLIHCCSILLFVVVNLVVEVISCALLGESQVGGEVVDAFVHCLLLLMQRSLCTKEVALCDVGGHVVVLLDEEWVGRSTWPIHHSKQICEREKEKNLYQMYLDQC